MNHDVRDRRIGRAAWVMAWVGLVVGQFHAMARHNTADGRSDLDSWTTRVWSDPARDFFSPLLDWASADTVYMTYGKIWFPVFAAFTACAFVLYQRRRPTGFEKFAWRFALVAYVWGVAAVFVTYWTQWTRAVLQRAPGHGLPVPGHPRGAPRLAGLDDARDHADQARLPAAGHRMADRPDLPAGAW